MKENEIRTDRNEFLLGKIVHSSEGISIEYRYKGHTDYISWEHLVAKVEEYKVKNKIIA